MKYTQQEQEMMQKMLLSPHFTLGEFIRSGTAIRRSIDNVPPDIIFIIRMMLLCENILEPLRKRFGAIPISSGYRCHLLNLAVGGAFGSQHELGEAADIPVASKEKMKQYVDRPAHSGTPWPTPEAVAPRELLHQSQEPPPAVGITPSWQGVKRETPILLNL